MEFSWNPNTKCTEKSQFSISMHPSSDVPSFSEICQPPGLNQQNGEQCCLPQLSFKVNLKDTSFHISWNSLGFDLSPKSLLNFLYLVYSTKFGKNFSICGGSPRVVKWSSPQFLPLGETLKRVVKTMTYFLKFNQKIWRSPWT